MLLGMYCILEIVCLDMLGGYWFMEWDCGGSIIMVFVCIIMFMVD